MAVSSSSQRFTANGTASGFNFGSAIDSVYNVLASVDGISQDPDRHYFLSGTYINFIVAPYNNSNIELRYIKTV
jgi:hypothetical protein